MITLALLTATGCTPQTLDDTGEAEVAPGVVPVDDAAIGATSITTTPHEEFGSLLVLRWQQTGVLSGVVEFAVDGVWQTAPEVTIGDGGAAEILLLGAPYETDVSWRFSGTLDGVEVTSQTHTGRTDDLPDGLPEAEVLADDADAWVETDRYLLASINQDAGGWTSGTYWKFILDRQGRYVWAHKTPGSNWSIFLRVSEDGDDILWDEATYWSQFDSGEGSLVHRMKLDGHLVESIPTPGLHHAFVELPDGTMVWGAADLSSEVLRQRTPDGKTADLWTCSDSFSVEYCQSNTLAYSPQTDTFLYSFYTNSSVVELDRDGRTLHYWGQNPEWGFSPEASQFAWQHGVHFLDSGNLLLSTHTTSGDLETVVREYAIDEESRTLREVWSFGEGEGLHAATAGEAHRLENGNTLHNYGSRGHLREVTSDGVIVWEVSWPGERLLGRSVFIADLYQFL